jgi:hypothetical protein
MKRVSVSVEDLRGLLESAGYLVNFFEQYPPCDGSGSSLEGDIGHVLDELRGRVEGMEKVLVERSV